MNNKQVIVENVRVALLNYLSLPKDSELFDSLYNAESLYEMRRIVRQSPKFFNPVGILAVELIHNVELALGEVTLEDNNV